MSVYNMKPYFVDAQSYREWRSGWLELYTVVSMDNRTSKLKIKSLQRSGEPTRTTAKEMKFKSITARKLMTVLDEAKIRWNNIREMKKGLEEQKASYPVTLPECKNIDFHFNKIAIEFPFMPSWILKIKGKSYYVIEVEANIPFSTRLKETGSTRGVIRFKRATAYISKDGIATLT